MRPILLEVEGFTCYRDRQPALKFSELSLFAIAGPTGAGKSTILDAMLYALYGQVPRLGKQGVTEMIAHGRDALSVWLDFEVQGRHYRVVRRVKKRTKAAPQTTVTFAEIVDGVEKSLGDGVKSVNEAIERVLGLRYADFIQTVILPQGEFARFLRAEPKGQREILQNLLRHGVFERMRGAAEEQRRELDARLRGVDGQLAMLEGATEEALAAREKELAEAHARLTAAVADKNAADAKLKEAGELHKLTKEVEQQRAQRSALDAQTQEVERARTELENARRAAAIQPRLEALEHANERGRRAKRERDDAARGLETADLARVAAEKRLHAAVSAAAVCDELALRVRRLDEIAGDIQRRAELTAKLRAIPPQLKAADAAIRSAKSAESSARKMVQAHEAQVLKLEAERNALPFDEPMYNALESVRDDLAQAKSLQRERDASAAEAESSSRAKTDALRKEEAAQVEHQASLDRAELAAKALQSAQTALDDGRDRHRAAALRAHLHAGDNCPVCLQVVTALPPVDTPPELTALEAECEAVAKRASEAERARQKASEALATATARRREAEKTARAADARAADRARAFGEALDRLAAAATGAAAVAGPELLGWIDGRVAQLRSLKAERDRLDAGLRGTESELATARLALAGAEAEAAQAAGRQDRVAQEQQRVEAELHGVIARIEAVTTHSDPRAERDELQRRMTDLRNAESQARQSHAQADAAINTARERLNAAETALADADAHLGSTREAVRQALDAAGFASEEAAAAAVRTPGQQRALDVQVTDYDRKLAAVLQRLADLEPQIARRAVSDAVLEATQKQCDEAAAQWRQADQSVTRLDDDCARLRQGARKRNELLTERTDVQGTLTVTAQLATDLRGDRFQEYVLEEAFKALVAGASVRMKAISNRYTLEWESGEFYVVDHDNAGERRRAETLSGGETFMASLCLALQLSDEVLRTSGALRMDSLFIDEGFGTLDSDTLAEVTDSIEALRHEAGRMIGVISHRPDLTDRLPGCIRVIPDEGEGRSNWTLERAG